MTKNKKNKSFFDRFKSLYGSYSKKIEKVDDGKEPNKQEKQKEVVDNDGWVKGKDGLWRKTTARGSMIRATDPNGDKAPYNKFAIGNYERNRRDFDRTTKVDYNKKYDDYDYDNIKQHNRYNNISRNNNAQYNRYNTEYGNHSNYSNYNRYNYYTPSYTRMASNLESLKSGKAICSVYFTELPEDATKGILAAYKVLSSISKSMISDSRISLDIKTRDQDSLKNLLNKCEYSVALNQEMFTEKDDLGEAIDIFLGNGIIEFSQILYRDEKYEHNLLEKGYFNSELFSILYECFEYNRIITEMKTNFSGFYEFAEKRILHQTEKLKELLTSEYSFGEDSKKIKAFINKISQFIRLSVEIPNDVIDDAEEDIKGIYLKINELLENEQKSSKDSFEKTNTLISEFEKISNDSIYSIDNSNSVLASIKKDIIDIIGSTSLKLDKINGTFRKLTGLGGGQVSPEAALDSNAEFRQEIEVNYAKLFEMPASKRKSIVLKVAPSNRESYLRNLESVNLYVSMLKKEFRLRSNNKINNFKGQRYGKFDDTKIVEALQGVNTVYTKRYKTISNKVNIGLLIDESGSMSGSKIDTAKKIAIMFYEALENIKNVNLSVYGHTADRTAEGSCDMLIYKEPRKKVDKYSLGTITSRGNNRDGDAIAESCERMIANGGTGILIILADGQPSAYHYDNGISHTRSIVQEYEKKGFDIVNVSIDAYYDPKSMYTNYFKFTNLSEVPNQMGKILKKLIFKRLTQTTIQI